MTESTNTILYADPTNEAARLLCADALEQLAYHVESGSWRNAYLTAALELRYGNQALNALQAKMAGIMMEMTPAMRFDFMAILMDKQIMAQRDFILNVTLSDLGQQYVPQVKNGVLLVFENAHHADADASITCPKNGFCTS